MGLCVREARNVLAALGYVPLALAGVFEFGLFVKGKSESNIKCAGRRPAVRTADSEKNDVALCAKHCDRAVLLRWHRQDCLCY